MFPFFFFFNQKTAYEMRISDWSSDVCSSDLSLRAAGVVAVSHHQGGENPMTLEQAGWLLRAKKIIIVADKDDAGAYCAAAHYNLLRDLGLSKIAIKRAAEGKDRSEEHTSELQSLMRISYAVF